MRQGSRIPQAAENLVHAQLFDENFLMVVASVGALCIGEYPEAVAVMILFSVGEIFEKNSFTDIEIWDDLCGIHRVVKGKNGGIG